MRREPAMNCIVRVADFGENSNFVFRAGLAISRGGKSLGYERNDGEYQGVSQGNRKRDTMIVVIRVPCRPGGQARIATSVIAAVAKPPVNPIHTAAAMT